MSLMILSLVGGAVAALSLAVSGEWQAGDPSQSLQLMAVQGARRIDACIRPACYFGSCRRGSANGSATQPAAILFWKNDNYPSLGKIQLAELAMIQHDPTTHTLMYYEAAFPAGMTSGQISIINQDISFSLFNSASAPDDFKLLPYVTGKPICHNISGARFFVSDVGSNTQRASLDYVLTFSRSMKVNGSDYNATQVQYGTATMRQPKDQPN